MTRDQRPTSWWLLGVAFPVLVLACTAVALGASDFDRRSLEPFFDRSSGEFPLRRSWFFEGVMHTGGRRAVFLLTVGLLAAGLWTRRREQRRAISASCLYVAFCVIATTLLIGVWKDLVGQSTPWNTLSFGGKQPWDDPALSRWARLLGSPGAHSSSGFAFLSLYFVAAFLGVQRRWLWLAPGLMLGGLFALTQHVRGAHPPSHEFWSLAVAWAVASGSAALARRLGMLQWQEHSGPANSASPIVEPSRLSPWMFGASALFAGIGFFALDLLLDELAGDTSPWRQRFEIIELAAMSIGLGAAAWLLSSRIIDARLRAAERLQREREERFRVLGRMAASTAHEVRNSLQTLRLIVDEQRLEVPGLREHALQPEIDACLARIDHAVELIHGFARRERSEDEQTDFAGAIRDVIGGVQRVFREREIVRIGEHAEPAWVYGADAHLRMVIENLLRNAVEAAPQGSVVELELVRCDADWVLAIRNERSSTARVDLDAPGISSKPGGLGLGLSIARQLAAQLGGSIEHEFQGLRVTCALRLPACDPRLAP